jgi:hypothetical protein
MTLYLKSIKKYCGIGCQGRDKPWGFHLKQAAMRLPMSLEFSTSDPGGYWWPPTYSNWLILTFFSSARFSVMMTFIFNCWLFTYGVFLKPYTTFRWILVASHLFQLAYFGIFYVNTSFCTSRGILGP